jgi:hypothetical protein
MRAKLEGKCDIERITKSCEALQNTLAEKAGTDELEWHNVNIYITLKYQGQNVDITHTLENGETAPIEMITFGDPEKLAKRAAAAAAKLAAKRPKLKLVG